MKNLVPVRRNGWDIELGDGLTQGKISRRFGKHLATASYDGSRKSWRLRVSGKTIGWAKNGAAARRQIAHWVYSDTCLKVAPDRPEPMRFGVYRKIEGKTGVGQLYQFLMLARHHTTGAHFVAYIPLYTRPEWSGTIRPCILERDLFEKKFEFVGEGLP